MDIQEGHLAREQWVTPSDSVLPAGRNMLAVKRGLDVILAVCLIILLFPFMLVVGFLVSLDTGGRPMYRQCRRGYKGNVFLIYKFRTMPKHAHALREELIRNRRPDTVIFKFKDDDRVTKLGRLIRKYSIDELPQLLNVVWGDMSLVGPRPFSVEVFQRQGDTDPEVLRWVNQRHCVRPGMTGLWQIAGRNDLPDAELVRLDLEYVRNWTLTRDFSILLRTLPAVIRGKGAY